MSASAIVLVLNMLICSLLLTRYNMRLYSNCKPFVMTIRTLKIIDDHRPLRVVSSICCTRVLLNIRGAYFTPNEPIRDGTTGLEKQSFVWGTLSKTSGTSNTVVPSDSERSGDRRNSGWTWNEDLDPPRRLSLRPISPFHCEIPDFI